MKKSLTVSKGLTNYQLKVIAIVSMLIDHFAYILFANLLSAAYAETERSGFWGWIIEHEKLLWSINDAMHWIGRLAFPIFCFLLVQGFYHTRSKGKYALRLAVFALISEVPYDMAFNGCLLTLGSNNVFFTLLMGLLLIWGISQVKQWLTGKGWQRLLYWGSVVLLTVAAASLVTFVFDSSYGAAGVLTVLVLYLMPKRPVLATVIGVVLLTVLNIAPVQLFALPTALLVALYNGQRGRRIKYFFYAFYPLHLLILTGLTALLGLVSIHWGYLP